MLRTNQAAEESWPLYQYVSMVCETILPPDPAKYGFGSRRPAPANHPTARPNRADEHWAWHFMNDTIVDCIAWRQFGEFLSLNRTASALHRSLLRRAAGARHPVFPAFQRTHNRRSF